MVRMTRGVARPRCAGQEAARRLSERGVAQRGNAGKEPYDARYRLAALGTMHEAANGRKCRPWHVARSPENTKNETELFSGCRYSPETTGWTPTVTRGQRDSIEPTAEHDVALGALSGSRALWLKRLCSRPAERTQIYGKDGAAALTALPAPNSRRRVCHSGRRPLHLRVQARYSQAPRRFVICRPEKMDLDLHGVVGGRGE